MSLLILLHLHTKCIRFLCTVNDKCSHQAWNYRAQRGWQLTHRSLSFHTGACNPCNVYLIILLCQGSEPPTQQLLPSQRAHWAPRSQTWCKQMCTVWTICRRLRNQKENKPLMLKSKRLEHRSKVRSEMFKRIKKTLFRSNRKSVYMGDSWEKWFHVSTRRNRLLMLLSAPIHSKFDSDPFKASQLFSNIPKYHNQTEICINQWGTISHCVIVSHFTQGCKHHIVL